MFYEFIEVEEETQDDILENFQQLNTAWNINHVAFNNATQGKHIEVTLPENIAPTNTLLDEANIYSQLSTLTGETELVWQRENNGDRIEWTGLKADEEGWTRLPSGILLKWGQATVVGGSSAILYPVAADTPVFAANPFIVLATPVGNSNNTVAISGVLTPLQFSATTYVANTAVVTQIVISYLAIGI